MSDLKEYICYIDESGDEGFGKLKNSERSNGQSQWFALGAAIVSKENDKLLPAWRDEISALRRQSRTRLIHFKDFNHNQRKAACSLLSEKAMGVCVLLSNKATILDSSKKEIYKQKGHLYNYLVRYLLERVTECCSRKAEQANAQARLKVIFSRRANTDYQQMKAYLTYIRDGKEKFKPVRSIDWNVFDPSNLLVENHSIKAGLQIADVVTSATFKAFEPDEYGNTETGYASFLKNRYIRSADGVLNNCGLTIIPKGCTLLQSQSDFITEMEGKNVRAPGTLMHIAKNAGAL
jgi:hypothetical protein